MLQRQYVQQYRVVFDEGHTVKSAGANLSKASVSLSSDRRWCCTGTPIANDVGDLLGQVGAKDFRAAHLTYVSLILFVLPSVCCHRFESNELQGLL